MPACYIMRTHADTNLVIPNLDRVIPVTPTPGWRCRDLVDIVDEDVDTALFVPYLLHDRGNLIIIEVIALDRVTFTACFFD